MPDEVDPRVLHTALELVERERRDLLWTLRSVLALHRGNAFASAPEQATLRGARALVGDCDATDDHARKALAAHTLERLQKKSGG